MSNATPLRSGTPLVVAAEKTAATTSDRLANFPAVATTTAAARAPPTTKAAVAPETTNATTATVSTVPTAGRVAAPVLRATACATATDSAAAAAVQAAAPTSADAANFGSADAGASPCAAADCLFAFSRAHPSACEAVTDGPHDDEDDASSNLEVSAAVGEAVSTTGAISAGSSAPSKSGWCDAAAKTSVRAYSEKMNTTTAETETSWDREGLVSICASTPTREQRRFQESATASAAPPNNAFFGEETDDASTPQEAVTSAAIAGTGTPATAVTATGPAIVSPPLFSSSQPSGPVSSLTSPSVAAASENKLSVEAPAALALTPSTLRHLPEATATASEAEAAAVASTTTPRSQVSKKPSAAPPLRVGKRETWRTVTATTEDAVAAVEAAAAAAGIFPLTAEAAATDLDAYTVRSVPGNADSCYAVVGASAAAREQQDQLQQLSGGGLARPLLFHPRDRGARLGMLALGNLNLVFKLVASALGALMLLFIVTHLDLVGPAVKLLLAKIQSLGAFSPLAFSLAYVLLVMCCVPAEPLHVAGGFIFVNLYGYKFIFIFNCMGAALRDVDEIDISHINLSSKKYLIAIFGLLMAFASVAYIGELTRRKLAQASEAAARRRMQEHVLLSNSVVEDVSNAA